MTTISNLPSHSSSCFLALLVALWELVPLPRLVTLLPLPPPPPPLLLVLVLLLLVVADLGVIRLASGPFSLAGRYLEIGIQNVDIRLAYRNRI